VRNGVAAVMVCGEKRGTVGRGFKGLEEATAYAPSLGRAGGCRRMRVSAQSGITARQVRNSVLRVKSVRSVSEH
jgi:hypothetical protein